MTSGKTWTVFLTFVYGMVVAGSLVYAADSGPQANNRADQSGALLQLKQEFNAILGKEPADLLIKNVKILDVHTERVFDGSLLIKNGKIIAHDPPASVVAKQSFDARGLYALPGFIDAHFHIDSQLVTPAAMASAIVPQGTTTTIAEILDFVGAAKNDGIKATKALFRDMEKLPYRIYAHAPGKKVDWSISRELLDWDMVIAQGEFNQFNFLEGKDEELGQIIIAREKKKLLHGHVKYLDHPYKVNLFAAVGTINDHNPWDYEQLEMDLRLGVAPMIREGEGDALDCMDRIVPGILKNRLPTDNMMFCTDNVSVGTVFKRGHIDYIIQKAIRLGIPPIQAIKMGSYNAARSFRLDDRIGSLAPGRWADIVLVEKIDQVKPLYVFKGGELVAREGKLLKPVSVDYADIVTKPSPGLIGLKREELELKPLELSPDGHRAKVKVIRMGKPSEVKDEWFAFKDGKVLTEPGKDYVRIAVIERYGKDGVRKVLNGFVTGFNLKKGALAGVYPSVTPQVCAIGTGIDELYAASTEIDRHTGGFMVSESGTVKAVLPLAIYGMMSAYSAEELADRVASLDKAGKELGYGSEELPWYAKMQIMFYMLDRVRLIK